MEIVILNALFMQLEKFDAKKRERVYFEFKFVELNSIGSFKLLAPAPKAHNRNE